MNEIDRCLDQVCRTLGGSKSLRHHIREELRGHLEEAIEQHVAEGLDRKEAEGKAIEAFGAPGVVSEGLQTIYGKRVVRAMIEKAMEWKEKNMKTGWKWGFVAHAALLSSITLALLLVLAMLYYVVPLLTKWYSVLGEPLPGDSPMMVNIFVVLSQYWYLWLLPIALAWGIFEWKNRSESKATIRLAVAAITSVLVTAAVWAIMIPVVWSFACLTPKFAHQVGPLTVQNVASANASFVALKQSVEAKNWERAASSADQLEDDVDFLHGSPCVTAILAGLSKHENIHDISALLRRMEKLSERIKSKIVIPHDQAMPAATAKKIAQELSQLEECHRQLAAMAPGWPDGVPTEG